MVAVNALANILPINGVGTGEVSDSFANLFAPSGITFSIWGLIYILLAIYVVYQSGMLSKDKTTINSAWLRKTGFLFVLSSMANTIWIFAWHYKIIELSLIMMLVILGSLISISIILKRQRLSNAEYFLVKVPFSVYFGWITVATIANITTQLVDWGWNGFGMSNQVWTIIVLAAGLAIGISTILSNRDWAYGLVLIWAYAGILVKHLSQTGFNGEYTGIIISVVVSLALFAAASLIPIFKRKTS
jgi:hypothetical protein